MIDSREITPDSEIAVKREYVMLTEWEPKQVFSTLEKAVAMVIASDAIDGMAEAESVTAQVVEGELWFSGYDADGNELFLHTEQFERVQVFFPAFPR